jgi:hypothetical protein
MSLRFALVLVCMLAAVRAQDEDEEYVPPRLDLPDWSTVSRRRRRRRFLPQCIN